MPNIRFRLFNPLQAEILFLYPLKKWKKASGFLMRKGLLAWNRFFSFSNAPGSDMKWAKSSNQRKIRLRTVAGTIIHEKFLFMQNVFFLHVYALFYNLQILLLEQTLLAKCSKKLSAIKKLERKLQRGSIALLFSCVCGCVCVRVVCVCKIGIIPNVKP